jgi:hypothetical protein
MKLPAARSRTAIVALALALGGGKRDSGTPPTPTLSGFPNPPSP